MKKINLLILFLVFGISLISATFSCNDFTSKWNYCGLMNISGIQCDNFWQNASDCSNPSNATFSLNTSNYYSKSDINAMFANFTIANITNGNNSIVIYGNFSSGFVSSEVFDAFKNSTNNAFAGFVTNATYSSDLYKFSIGQYSTNNNQSNNSSQSGLFILMIILMALLVGVVVFFVVKQSKPQPIQLATKNYPQQNFGRHDDEDPEDLIKRGLEKADKLEKKDKESFAKDKEKARRQ